MFHSAGNSNEDGGASTSNAGSIIGGVLGGVILLLLLIIIAPCAVLCSIKCIWLYDKRKVAKFNSNINMTNNPSYDTNKQNINLTYDYAASNEFVHLQQDAIKLNYPSHGRIQNHEAIFNDKNNVTEPDHNVPIELNPSYSSKLRKISEDHSQSAEVDTINVTINPNEVMTGGIKLQDDPSYNEIKCT